jgi:hypothetical protein
MALPLNAVLLSNLKLGPKFIAMQKASWHDPCTLSPVEGFFNLPDFTQQSAFWSIPLMFMFHPIGHQLDKYGTRSQ